MIEGRARALAGDTLEVSGVRLRLQGIAAPAPDQQAGPGSLAALERLLAYARNVAVCRRVPQQPAAAWCYAGGPDGVDLGREMVAMGWARACPRIDARYLPEEDLPRAARAGVWAAGYRPPGGCAAD